ncbi:hypothetical protein [Thermomonospora amylolytica]|uniref:hypothetical protein n=1 Tax=Thermomonospora amylolytica TaxID=1411117 RepID=UPI00130063DC|nr:hypothetical protein [Thermomonospora amylolytica]
MTELEARLQEMRKDVAVWQDMAGEMRQVGGVIAGLQDVRNAFGYLGKSVGTDQAFAAVHNVLQTLSKEADGTFRDVANRLQTVIRVYEGKETQNQELIKKVREGWRI